MFRHVRPVLISLFNKLLKNRLREVPQWQSSCPYGEQELQNMKPKHGGFGSESNSDSDSETSIPDLESKSTGKDTS